MIPLAEIKKELVSALRALYPEGYAFYGLEVTEGYKKPSFFTQLLQVSCETETMWTKKRLFIYEITYFQKEVDEADALEKISAIEKAFGNKVKIKDRYANVSEVESRFAGKFGNIPQVKVTFSFLDAAGRGREEGEPARSVPIKTRMEEPYEHEDAGGKH